MAFGPFLPNFLAFSNSSLTGTAIPRGHRAGLKNMSLLTETVFVKHPGTSSPIKPIARPHAPDPVRFWT
jgi:aldehyde:ferredoxin oxidoreductase